MNPISFLRNSQFATLVLVCLAGPPLRAQSPAVIATLPATDVGSSGATLHGDFQGAGEAGTARWFEWGLTTNYGNITLTTSPAVVLDNLIWGSTYHFRAGMSNQAGTVHGGDVVFSTRELFRTEPAGVAPLPAVGRGAGWLAADDFNGDGLVDLACANRTDGSLSVLLRLPGGGFGKAPGSPIPVPAGPVTVYSADFNGDGFPDLISSSAAGNAVSFFLGDGTGRFTPGPGSPFSTANSPWGIAIGDLNGDGLPDAGVVHRYADTLKILFGNRDNGLVTGVSMPCARSLSLTAGDLDGDGDLDLVSGNSEDAALSVLLGDGGGGFVAGPSPHLPVASATFGIVIADLDRDGIADIASTDTYGHSVSIWLGQGSGRFRTASQARVFTAEYPRWIGVIDMNGDGLPDLVTANEGSGNQGGTISILTGVGDGTFGVSNMAAGLHSNGLALIDFNDDAILDLVCVNGGTDQEGPGSLSFFANRRLRPALAAITGQADQVSETVARFAGTITSVLRPVSAWFEWGTNALYGSSTPAVPVSDGRAAVSVRFEATGLRTLATYQFRLVVSDGTNTWYGANSFFLARHPFDYVTDEAGVTIVGANEALSELDIPAEIGGRPVVRIEQYAFGGRPVRRVTIPDSVERIGTGAFQFCDRLEHVSIGAGVQAIEPYAFADCITLTDVTGGAGLRHIGQASFANCSMLGGFVVGDRVSVIGSEAFLSCTSMTNLTLGDSLRLIGDSAFANCQSLSEIIIPSGVVSIGNLAFVDCSGVQRLVLREGLLSIGDSAFLSCSALARITVPASVEVIGNGAFDTRQWRSGSPSGAARVFGGILRGGSLELSFLGDAPAAASPFDRQWGGVFEDGTRRIVIRYLQGAAGWRIPFGGVAPTPWLPRMVPAGSGPGKFGFEIDWAAGRTVVIEACDDLAGRLWRPVGTNLLSVGPAIFADTDSINHPRRFYRLREPEPQE